MKLINKQDEPTCQLAYLETRVSGWLLPINLFPQDLLMLLKLDSPPLVVLPEPRLVSYPPG